MSGSSSRQRRWALVGGAVVAAAAVLAVYAVAVLTPTGQAIDTRLMIAVAAALEDADWTTAALALVSPGTLILAICLVSCLALHRGVAAAGAAAATVVLTVVGAQVLKASLTRPTWWDAAANSLPSGHVAAVAGLAAALVLACPAVLRPVAAAGGVVAVALVGLATMALEWHRPSDVVAAALLAVSVASVAAAVSGAGRRSTDQPQLSQTPVAGRAM